MIIVSSCCTLCPSVLAVSDLGLYCTCVLTPLLCGDHQSLRGLSPALVSLGRDAEHVDPLRIQPGHCVPPGPGAEQLHHSRVAVGGIQPVCNLIGWMTQLGQGSVIG